MDVEAFEAEARDQGGGSGESTLTVVIALGANALLAMAKSVAAALTGSAAMVAEAAHSWSDTGNEVFLLIAERSGRRPRDAQHPRGYGRQTYIWSLVAAFGLFSAGAMVSIWHGVTDLLSEPGDAGSFTINYVILGISVLLEGSSFFQANRQVHGKARTLGLHPFRYVSRTSDSTLRAVFFEDASALIGIALAGGAIALHQATGEAAYDACGSIAVGLLLAVVAIFLMRRNMAYLLGQGLSQEMQREVLRTMLEHPEIERITYLHVEYVGPSRLFVVAAVDLVGDDREGQLALRFRRVEADIERSDLIEDAVLTPAPPDEPALTADGLAS
ncbi:cation diffusion facilitator family transporter [Nocardioides sp. BP30]|uniref:cation diffusion facilitator family transporter n=1 Tax=Nocardioides sp. BP30 TaxID=3036374 RepID=UPI00246844A2|nr:cation diffusion facilitator family transporter [Nocardioides sp. BP30]WGL51337.1 cation diffusion facilitator family transporter [Nocardioides sp. BP30]